MKITTVLYFILKIIIFVFLYSVPAYSQCVSCTHQINGSSSANITVNGSRKYCINSGTFTGNITGPSGGSASICIMPGVNFNPASISNWNGLIINYGNADVPSTSINGNAVLENYGNWLSDGISMNGSHNELHNKNTGYFVISNNFTIPGNGSFTNEGDAVIEGDFIQNGIFSNEGNTHIEGNYTSNGPAENTGTLILEANATLGGNAEIDNQCKMVCFGNITSSGKIHNEGFFWLTAGSLINSGNLSQTNSALLRGIHFTNSGNITGSGQYYFSGSTINSGWVGQDAQGINFFDATLANPTRFFDTQSNAPHNSVTKNSFSPADTISWSSGGNANAGSDQWVCDSLATLNAVGTNGVWNLISGNGIIYTPSQPSTLVSNLSYGENIFKWSTPAACGTALDYVSVFRTEDADTTIWTGNFSNNWHAHQNWTKCIPGVNTFAIIEYSTSAQPVILNGKIGHALKVEMKSNAHLTISNNAQLRVKE